VGARAEIGWHVSHQAEELWLLRGAIATAPRLAGHIGTEMEAAAGNEEDPPEFFNTPTPSAPRMR
jgi:hypothetical protein